MPTGCRQEPRLQLFLGPPYRSGAQHECLHILPGCDRSSRQGRRASLAGSCRGARIKPLPMQSKSHTRQKTIAVADVTHTLKLQRFAAEKQFTVCDKYDASLCRNR